jgi:hypothetical protein
MTQEEGGREIVMKWMERNEGEVVWIERKEGEAVSRNERKKEERYRVHTPFL